MQNLEIKLWPYPSLLTRCQTVTKVDKQLLEWIQEMQKIVRQFDAAGLAANQVGLPYRIYVTADEVFINPVITKHFGGYAVAEEGCLSFPDTYLPIARSKKVAINAFNERGEEIKKTLSGLNARIAQHECDHLDALMYFNRMPVQMITESGLLAKLDAIQNVYLESVESGEVSLESILEELIRLKLERTDWKQPAEKSTTVGG